MDIKKFGTEIGNDKIFLEHRGKEIRQMVIDKYNSLGYKLYYYKDFQLIEINKVVHSNGRKTWGKDWSDFIFFLNNEEYEYAMKVILKSKELYDQLLEQAKTVAELPLSSIYYDILKLDEK